MRRGQESLRRQKAKRNPEIRKKRTGTLVRFLRGVRSAPCGRRKADRMAQREMEFKMERRGLLKAGDHVTVSEGLLPSNYYYTINPSLAMSGNVPFPQRLRATEGDVISVEENERGFYVKVVFEEK